MKITARLPVFIDGTPKRTKGPKTIAVSRDVVWDIPEVSSSETDLAFESFEAWDTITNEDDPLKRKNAYVRYRNPVTAIRYGESLYRRVAGQSPELENMFSRSFPNGWGHNASVGVGGKISRLDLAFQDTDWCQYPLASPVFQQMLWQFHIRSTKDTTFRDGELWPQSVKAPEGEGGLFGRRNHVTFEEALPLLERYDHGQLEDSLRTHSAHMDRFLLVDGALWMQTKPPVYRVDAVYRNGFEVEACVGIVFLPDWHDTRLGTQYFSLGAKEEAFATANEMADVYGHARRAETQYRDGELKKTVFHSERRDVVDLTTENVVHDPAILAYRHEEEELRRMSFGVAVEANRFITRNPPWRDKFGTVACDALASSMQEVAMTNYVTDVFGDASDALRSNADIWRRTRRGCSTYAFGSVEASNAVLARALRYEEDKPISAPALGSVAPTPF